MPDLEQMKQKYASVFTAIQQEQIRLSHVHIQENKLFIQGEAPSDQAKNRVWDVIKTVNPNWAQDLTADISVDASAAPASAPQGKTYTVKPGDSLSKISKDVYGDANQYNRIFEANRDVLSDPNRISPGQTLRIPS